MANKAKSVYLTDRSMSALRRGESLSSRMNQMVDRYLSLLEVSREHARGYFDESQWKILREAHAGRRPMDGALMDLHGLVADLGHSELAIALEHMPVWQGFMVLELLEEDAVGLATHS